MQGKTFTVKFEDKSYELSATVYPESVFCEFKLNGDVLEKHPLKPGAFYYLVSRELDGHQFLVWIQKKKRIDLFGITETEYLFECFADGISVSDGVTPLELYIRLEEHTVPLSKKIRMRGVETIRFGAIAVVLFLLLVLLARVIAYDSFMDAFVSMLIDALLCIGIYSLIMLPYILLSRRHSRRVSQRLSKQLREFVTENV